MELPLSSQQASSSPSSRTRPGGLRTRLGSLFSSNSSLVHVPDGAPPMVEHPALRKSGSRRGFHIFRHRKEARDGRAGAGSPPSGRPPSYATIDPAVSTDATSQPFTSSSLQTSATENFQSTPDVLPHDVHGSGDGQRHGEAWVRRPRRKYGLFHRNGVSRSVWKDRLVRRKILSCSLSGLVLAIVLAVYLAFAVSSSAYGQEFQVLLILLIMIFTVVFCHSLLRLAMILLRGPRDEVATNRVPSRVGPMGYAQPERPIHVILARDEEIAADGEEREKVRPPPPAYGLWRSSVRINPNLLYWQRVEPMPTVNENGESRPDTATRPPSYTSDNGVDYVVHAQPRSIAPDRVAGRPPASEEDRMV